MEEQIVLVDDRGTVLGQAPKLASHHAKTPLHLGFSCYLFDTQGRFLLTQRAHGKKVWPGVWTNTACGHPAPNETTPDAVKRRLSYELGITEISDIALIEADYRYKTDPFNGIIENEICPIYIARALQAPSPNPDEVEAYLWQTWEDTRQQLQSSDEKYSYWFRQQFTLVDKNPLLPRYLEGSYGQH